MRTLVTLVLVVAAGLAPAGATVAPAQAAAVRPVTGYHATGVTHNERAEPPGAKPTVAYRDLALPTGQTATVFSNGIAEVFSAGHRSAQYRMVAPDGVAGAGTDADHDLAERIADAAGESCPGADIRIGYLNGTADQLADALPPEPEGGRGTAPHAIIVPLLAGPHPIFDAEIAAAISRMPVPVMLAAHLGPHPLLAGALHDRLSQVGLARASRVRGLSIQAGANGVLVVADRGPQAIGVVGVSTVLLASRLAVPAAPASLGDPVSIDAALTRLREAGVTHAAIAACVIGPETNPAEWEQLCAALGAPCTEPLGNHPAIAQLVSIRYGEALARIVAAGN